MSNRYGIPETTVEDLVLFCDRRDCVKHDLHGDDVKYARDILNSLSNSEFLEKLSDAIEERLKAFGGTL